MTFDVEKKRGPSEYIEISYWFSERLRASQIGEGRQQEGKSQGTPGPEGGSRFLSGGSSEEETFHFTKDRQAHNASPFQRDLSGSWNFFSQKRETEWRGGGSDGG